MCMCVVVLFIFYLVLFIGASPFEGNALESDQKGR